MARMVASSQRAGIPSQPLSSSRDGSRDPRCAPAYGRARSGPDPGGKPRRTRDGSRSSTGGQDRCGRRRGRAGRVAGGPGSRGGFAGRPGHPGPLGGPQRGPDRRVRVQGMGGRQPGGDHQAVLRRRWHAQLDLAPYDRPVCGDQRRDGLHPRPDRRAECAARLLRIADLHRVRRQGVQLHGRVLSHDAGYLSWQDPDGTIVKVAGPHPSFFDGIDWCGLLSAK